MKILFDHQIFTAQKYGGISRYFFEIIKEIRRNKNIETDVPLLFSNNHYLNAVTIRRAKLVITLPMLTHSPVVIFFVSGF